MTPETESTTPRSDLDEEQEVDFGRYFRAILVRWWLPVAGIVLGIIAGLLVSTGSRRPFQAAAVVYLGSPTAPGGGTLLPRGTKFGFAGQFILSDPTIRQVADRVGVRFSALRDAVSLEPVSALTGEVATGATNFAQIRVEGLSRAKALQAANELAVLVERDFSTFVDLKLRNYRARRARAHRELAEVNARIESALKRQSEVVSSKLLPATEKFLLLANLNNVLGFNENRQANIEGSLLTVEELIAAAEQVERARVLEPARASRVAAPSSRTSAAIGGLVGLLIGILAALLWDPIAGRLEKSRERA
jgi:hypothetical protein